ncbi:hypothetical protein GGR50DRAFT_690270 [Xylaria sp. CBS 124048]|nr:hypothetical protein GGR50DRAFT_690270 [Xylaria sp. CBS 124048]
MPESCQTCGKTSSEVHLKRCSKCLTALTICVNKTWLHDRPEMEVYKLLLDAYRLRVKDEFTLERRIPPNSIYSGAKDGFKGFTRFLGLANSRRVLPPWWTPEKADACKKLGMDSSRGYDLRRVINKSEVIERYSNRLFPMQLRMFAEIVIGRGIGGGGGEKMRKMMMAQEGNTEGFMSILDISGSLV